METNESVKRSVMQEVESEVLKLLEQVQGLREGDLKGVEEQVLVSAFAIGRRVLEGIINAQTSQPRSAARRQGVCGHEQRLVSQRPKEVLTLLGPITVRRPYYQCQHPESAGRQGQECRHGEAPSDTRLSD